jgi:hypothetical protein
VNFRASSLLVWFAVGGGACAWAAQHVVGIGFGWAECNQPGRGIPVHAGQAVAAAVAAAVTLASMGVGAWLFRHTYQVGDVFGEERRGDGATPPVGRIHFLALVGLVVNLLVLAIIVMDGIGAPLLSMCQQA